MKDKVYYDELQVMVDKAKELKRKLELNTDNEAKGYLKLALDKIYLDMRNLIKHRDTTL
tara:strand:- start:143 stop:319 length:177 start_codon:yes stop_codon:yes gene_type:complete